MTKDYYRILGVSHDATIDEIKKAYKRLALKYHPDRTKGDKEAEEKFKEINEAYYVLKDPQRRAQYDRFGSVDGIPNFTRDFGFGFDDLFGEIFSEFFGFGKRTSAKRATRGENITVDLEIDLKEAVFGAKKEVTFTRKITCPICFGTGSKDGILDVCTQCGGTGQVVYRQGFLSIQSTCSSCRGSGKIIKEFCGRCAGEGTVYEKKKVEVDIPRGVDDSSILRLSGLGSEGKNGGPPGDLYIHVVVKKNDHFYREGKELYQSIFIPFSTAVLGGDVNIPLLEGGYEKLKIPAGTESGHVFRLKNRGAYITDDRKRGDMLVEIRIKVPKKPSREYKRLIEELKKYEKDDETEDNSIFNFFKKSQKR